MRQLPTQDCIAPVDCGAKDAALRVKHASHARVLRSLAGKKKADGRLFITGDKAIIGMLLHVAIGNLLQRGSSLLGRAGKECNAMLKVGSSRVQLEGEIGERGVGVIAEISSVPLAERLESFYTFCRDGDDLGGDRETALRLCGRSLFNDDVRIGSTEAK